MNKLYSVHDHWTDINKKNDVDIESIDGVITQIKVNGEDYGGVTWNQVYTGTIDPEGEVPPFSVNISLTMAASDTIKVVYDNTEYILPKQIINENICYGASADAFPESIDFSNCPFLIQVLPDSIRVYTETAGAHTLTISEPQSGGGESDFSTAEVTLLGANLKNIYIPTVYDDVDSSLITPVFGANSDSEVFTVALYKGKAYAFYNEGGSVIVSGDIEITSEIDDTYGFIITGDCTITIS